MRRLLALSCAGASALAIAACGDSSTVKPNTSGDSTQASSPPPTTTAAAAPSTGCTQVATPSPRQEENLAKPKGRLDKSKTYTVTMNTNCGSFSFKLDVKQSPHAAASIASLVRKGFYSNLAITRIVQNQLFQGGDPEQVGAGGPGYTVVDKVPSDVQYTQGTIAMAKSGADPKGASGSQFFAVTSAQPATFDGPNYAVAGHITKGLDVAKRIVAIGPGVNPQYGQNVGDGPPQQNVVIKSATLKVSG